MDNDGTCENSQVSASKKWLTLAVLPCNWQLKLVNFRKLHRSPWDINVPTFINLL